MTQSQTANSKTKTKKSTTRRRFLTKAGTATAATASLSTQMANVVAGETDSGNVEITVNYSCPSNTSLDITVKEYDPNDSLTATSGYFITPSTSQPLTWDTDLFEGEAGEGYGYVINAKLESSDGSNTPELDSVTVTLPGTYDAGTTTTTTESPITVPDETTTETTTEEFNPEPTTVGENETTTEPYKPPGDDDSHLITNIVDNTAVFILSAIFGFGAIGLSSRSMAIAAWASYMAFAYIGLSTGYLFLENLVYATLVLIFVAIGWKVWKLEGGG